LKITSLDRGGVKINSDFHPDLREYILSKINNVAHYFQPAASKFEQWACKSDASEEYKQMTLRTFQTAPL